MSDLQKIEFATINIFIVSIILSFLVGFGVIIIDTKFREIIASGLVICGLIIPALIFLVTYIVKISKENNKLLKLLWGLFPFVAIFFSLLFATGIAGIQFETGQITYNTDFIVLKALIAFIAVILYNIYILFYYGLDKKMFFTTFLYNFSVIFTCLKTEGNLNMICHCYLLYLLIAISFGYIELLIRNYLKKLQSLK